MTKTAATGPSFRLPMAAFVMPGLLLAIFLLQILAGPDMRGALIADFGLNPILLRAGQYDTLVTYGFLQGGVLSAVVNAVLILLFGASVLSAMGPGPRALLSYVVFYMVGVVTAGLGFCLAHLHDNYTVVGASGAVSILIGAGIRLPGYWGGAGRIAGLFSPRALIATALWCAYNLYGVVTHAFTHTPETSMAWESHLTSYFVGLLLIEPWLRLFHRNYMDATPSVTTK